MNSLDDVIKTRNVIVTCGTGGVGKTTISAAMAVRAACLGKKAVVITIDPAKRLATSLGVKELGNTPTDLTGLLRQSAEGKFDMLMGGSLWAVVPDTRRTFEELIASLSPDETFRKRVSNNPIVQILGREFSGANEYMALQRLNSLLHHADFECIVLDTPPSKNTVSFLEAPELLAQFFEERLIRWLVVPANRLLSVGIRKAVQLLERLTGESFLTHLVDFAGSLFEVRFEFAELLRKMGQVFTSGKVGFVVVAVPSGESFSEILGFVNVLEQKRYPFDGMILNRSLELPDPAPHFPTLSPRLEQLKGATLSLMSAIKERERRDLQGLEGYGLIKKILSKVPELSRDIHNLRDLLEVASFLNQTP